jgi:hypothetical protein
LPIAAQERPPPAGTPRSLAVKAATSVDVEISRWKKNTGEYSIAVEKKIFWLCFFVLDTIAGLELPLWWALFATIPAVMISWWVAYRSGWLS